MVEMMKEERKLYVAPSVDIHEIGKDIVCESITGEDGFDDGWNPVSMDA